MKENLFYGMVFKTGKPKKKKMVLHIYVLFNLQPIVGLHLLNVIGDLFLLF